MNNFCFGFVIFILLCMHTGRLHAQENPEVTGEWIENLVEDMVSRSDGEADASELLDYLYSLRDKPLNLNHATAEELAQMRLLTDFQIQSLMEYIKTNGELASLYELQYIPGYSEELVKRLMPFVRVSEEDRPVDDMQEISSIPGKGMIIVRMQQALESQAGFRDTSGTGETVSANELYTGSPGRYFLQYRYQVSTRILAGITLEKDNGEPFLCKGKIPVTDYYSLHFMASNIGFIKSLAIGDYQVGFGQGLTWWSGYGYGKGSSIQNLKKSRQGLRPHTSADENRYMRGIAATLVFGKWEGTFLVSRKAIDAHVTFYDSSRREPVYFSSFQTTGIHAIASEIRDKDAVTEEAAGGHIMYRGDRMNLGLTYMHTSWNAAYSPSFQPYKLYSFRGRSIDNGGFDYEVRMGKFLLFGESSVCGTGGWATMNGLSLNLQREIYLSLIQRNYSKDYFSPYLSAFSESWGAANERGVYSGLSLKPLRNLQLTAYMDIFSFPWLKYKVNNSSSGSDFLLLAEYFGGEGWVLSLRYQQEQGMTNGNAENPGIAPLSQTKKEKLRLNLTASPSAGLSLRSRLEVQRLQRGTGTPENAFLLYQDVLYRFTIIPLRVVLRYSMFRAASYDSRIYSYENDMQYVYSVPSYYGEGMRYYLLLNWKASSKIDLWFKAGRTVYTDRSSVGTGPAMIDANHKTDIGIELRMRF